MVKDTISYVAAVGLEETFKICIIELLPPTSDPPDRWVGLLRNRKIPQIRSEQKLSRKKNKKIPRGLGGARQNDFPLSSDKLIGISVSQLIPL